MIRGGIRESAPDRAAPAVFSFRAAVLAAGLCVYAAAGARPAVPAAKSRPPAGIPFGEELVDACAELFDFIRLSRDTLFVYDSNQTEDGRPALRFPFRSVVGDTLDYSGVGFLRSRGADGRVRYFFIFDPERPGDLSQSPLIEVIPRKNIRPGIRYVPGQEGENRMICQPAG